jgi:hypothetical protein
MKPVAAIVLNRNLPEVTDALCERLERSSGDVADIFVVESGSDRDRLSRRCTWWADWPESLEMGLRYPRGFNFALSRLLAEGRYGDYEHFLLLVNDAEIPEEPWVAALLEVMREHPRVGILSPCSRTWGERELIGPEGVRYFWHMSQIAWLLRRRYVDDVRELEEPTYMNFLYDGENFRGYESEIELVIKGYINDWASAITTRAFVDEDKNHLVTKHQLIRTEPFEESVLKCVQEGKRWMRRKYGFHSRWCMQMYAKLFYESFFVNYPYLAPFKIC